MSVAPADVGAEPARALPRGGQRQDRAGTLQREGLLDEVELPAHAADDLPVFGPVGHRRAQQQCMGNRVADLADADLQRAAIADQARGVEPHRVLGQPHRALDQRKELMRALGRAHQRGTVVGGQLGRAGHDGQIGVDLPHQREIDRAPAPRRRSASRSLVMSVLQDRLRRSPSAASS